MPDYNLTFGIEKNEWNNIASEKTLYQNYYQNYIESIFNIKRRSFSYKAILPLRILLKLELNDVLNIKNNYYRIDNYNLNLLTREVTLNLINSFDSVLGAMTTTVTNLYADSAEQVQSVYINNLGNPLFDVDGVLWLSLTYEGNNVYYSFLENTTGLDRTVNTTITNTETLEVVEILVTQYSEAI